MIMMDDHCDDSDGDGDGDGDGDDDDDLMMMMLTMMMIMIMTTDCYANPPHVNQMKIQIRHGVELPESLRHHLKSLTHDRTRPTGGTAIESASQTLTK